MGFVRVRGLIGGTREQAQEVEFLTDTGAFYTLLPLALAQTVGITLTHKTGIITADKREVTVEVGAAYLRLSDREAIVLVGVLDVPMPLLGVSALEALGFKVDPVAGSLEPTRPFGPAALLGVYPRIQICTIEDLLAGNLPKLPRSAYAGFAKAERIKQEKAEQARF